MLQRVLAGRINGVHAPEGSIMGPMWTDELLVVVEYQYAANRVILGFATPIDLEARTPSKIDEPHTMAEYLSKRRQQVMVRAHLSALFGGEAGV